MTKSLAAVLTSAMFSGEAAATVLAQDNHEDR